METFIVLGLCFILYEALDLFQSCYNKERRQQQQHFSADTNSSTISCNSSECNKSDSTIASDFTNATSSNNNSIIRNKDTAHLMLLDSIEEIDSDDNQSNQFDKNKVYSICDRVINQPFDNSDNNVVCVDDSAKLIVG